MYRGTNPSRGGRRGGRCRGGGGGRGGRGRGGGNNSFYNINNSRASGGSAVVGSAEGDGSASAGGGEGRRQYRKPAHLNLAQVFRYFNPSATDIKTNPTSILNPSEEFPNGVAFAVIYTDNMNSWMTNDTIYVSSDLHLLPEYAKHKALLVKDHKETTKEELAARITAKLTESIDFKRYGIQDGPDMELFDEDDNILSLIIPGDWMAEGHEQHGLASVETPSIKYGPAEKQAVAVYTNSLVRSGLKFIAWFTIEKIELFAAGSVDLLKSMRGKKWEGDVEHEWAAIKFHKIKKDELEWRPFPRVVRSEENPASLKEGGIRFQKQKHSSPTIDIRTPLVNITNNHSQASNEIEASVAVKTEKPESLKDFGWGTSVKVTENTEKNGHGLNEAIIDDKSIDIINDEGQARNKPETVVVKDEKTEGMKLADIDAKEFAVQETENGGHCLEEAVSLKNVEIEDKDDKKIALMEFAGMKTVEYPKDNGLQDTHGDGIISEHGKTLGQNDKKIDIDSILQEKFEAHVQEENYDQDIAAKIAFMSMKLGLSKEEAQVAETGGTDEVAVAAEDEEDVVAAYEKEVEREVSETKKGVHYGEVKKEAIDGVKKVKVEEGEDDEVVMKLEKEQLKEDAKVYIKVEEEDVTVHIKVEEEDVNLEDIEKFKPEDLGKEDAKIGLKEETDAKLNLGGSEEEGKQDGHSTPVAVKKDSFQVPEK
ncbi:hypothetical protein N0V88_007411 [Collariella sp. IMI 366227]|nr:hypothetical protein N0V88_007411 [Collariella sp. IMI 366227]